MSTRSYSHGKKSIGDLMYDVFSQYFFPFAQGISKVIENFSPTINVRRNNNAIHGKKDEESKQTKAKATPSRISKGKERRPECPGGKSDVTLQIGPGTNP